MPLVAMENTKFTIGYLGPDALLAIALQYNKNSYLKYLIRYMMTDRITLITIHVTNGK